MNMNCLNMENLTKCFENHTSLKNEVFSATHKKTLHTICTSSEAKILNLQEELKSWPVFLQEELLRDIEKKFEHKFILHLRWKQPANWLQKYFCLILNRVLFFAMDEGIEKTCYKYSPMNKLFNKVPTHIKNEAFECVIRIYQEPRREKTHHFRCYPSEWVDKYWYLIAEVSYSLDKEEYGYLYNDTFSYKQICIFCEKLNKE